MSSNDERIFVVAKKISSNFSLVFQMEDAFQVEYDTIYNLRSCTNDIEFYSFGGLVDVTHVLLTLKFTAESKYILNTIIIIWNQTLTLALTLTLISKYHLKLCCILHGNKIRS
jgi:hypothetical protein